MLADAHRAVKLEGTSGFPFFCQIGADRSCGPAELRERLFRQWTTNARKTRDLRERYEAVLSHRRHAMLERSWDQWRERTLRGVETQLEQRRNARERERAWDWWKSRTKVSCASREG